MGCTASPDTPEPLPSFEDSARFPGERAGGLEVPLNQEIFAQPIKLVRLDADTYAPAAPAPTGWRARTALLFRRHVLFMVVVAFPTLLAAFYFFAIAAERYESEAEFVVRSPATAASNQLNSVVQGPSNSMRSSDDAYIVVDFMLSRDAMDYLITNADLQKLFDRPEADFIWRYPGLFFSENRERLFKHYLRFVSIDYDETTGIADLKVQAFRPADAQRIANVLIARAEILTNELNDRSSADAIRTALAEVQNAERQAHAALDALTRFRDREKMIDPSEISVASLNTIAQLSLETAEANAELSEIEKVTPSGPHIDELRNKIAALQAQIASEQLKLTGSSNSLAPELAEYQNLMLDQKFAEKAFLSALTSLESARVDAERQRVFVEQVTTADLPDYPAYPYRAVWTLVTLLSSLLCWRVVKTFLDRLRSHGSNEKR
jgi:capsular polysaccharide transport system permease protein